MSLGPFWETLSQKAKGVLGVQVTRLDESRVLMKGQRGRELARISNGFSHFLRRGFSLSPEAMEGDEGRWRGCLGF